MIALGVLVALGIGLRAWLFAGQNPGFFGSSDSTWYILAAQSDVFRLAVEHNGNPWPAGYPAFLASLHALDPRLAFALIVQHCLGIATALLLYLTVRRVTSAPWALIPAAVVLLAGAQLLLEHTPLAESLFTFLIAAFTYCAARALDGQPLLWGALAGVLAAGATVVRVAGMPFLAIVVVWLLLGTSGGAKRRLTAALAAVLGISLVIGTYLIEMRRETGFGGPALTRGGQWKAPTRAEGPLAFATRVGHELTRYWSSPRARSAGESFKYIRVSGYDYNGIQRLVQTPDPKQRAITESYYETGVERIGNGVLAAFRRYERHTRLEGAPFMLLLLLAVIGLPFARGRRLSVGVLMLATSLAILITPLAYVYFDARYAVPGYGPLAATAAIGAAALWGWLAARRRVAE